MILKLQVDDLDASIIKYNLADYVTKGNGLVLKIEATNGLSCPERLSIAMETTVKAIILELLYTDSIQ
jgi:hypothetical protein